MRVEDLELAPLRQGTRLRLRVKAGARQDAILGVHAGALKLGVTEPPEKGKANKAVLELLGATLGVAPSSLELISGHACSDKVVYIPLPPAAVAQRLAA